MSLTVRFDVERQGQRPPNIRGPNVPACHTRVFCGLSILIGRSGIERHFNTWDPSPESTIPSQSGQGIELELVRSGQSALMATKLQAGVEGREDLIVRSCQFFTKVLCEPVRHV